MAGLLAGLTPEEERLAREYTHQARMPGLLSGDIPNRSAILPVSRDEYGRTVPAWPQAALDAWRLFQLPGQVLRGEAEATPADTMEMALGMVGGGTAFGGVPKGALGANGIRAYHGSPHDFDRFSLDKIGTGEGAQAYGHGLYFAEKEGVAKSYRDDLSDPDNFPLRIKDKPLDTVWTEELRERFPDMYRGLNEDDAMAMDGILGTLQGVTTPAAAKDIVKYSMPREWQGLANRRVLPELHQPQIGPGKMYEVNIKADPEDFLDWDKPLSDTVAEKIKRVGGPVQTEAKWSDKTKAGGIEFWSNNGTYIVENADGTFQYGTGSPWALDRQGWAKSLDEAKQKAAVESRRLTGMEAISGIDRKIAPSKPVGGPDTVAALREAGIPGIKYLDQGSRAAGDGSRNYVVFDDNLIEILRKYGLLGTMGGGAAASSLLPGMERKDQ